MEMKPEFWRCKRILVTGHTGFKGSWLCLWLHSLGAEVIGYALPPPTEPSLFVLADIQQGIESLQGDILDLEHVRHVVRRYQPQIVFHLAAQALVRRSYADPVGTYATNALGTAHILEAVRDIPSVQAVVIVTSDKCYENHDEKGRMYRETDRLGGDDPYSASKAAAEVVTSCFRKSFFQADKSGPKKAGVASARAGNVIGGGDWAADRLIPDVMRAVLDGKELFIRSPHSVRPWQHALNPLCGYLTLAERLCDDPGRFSEGWNFGPDVSETCSVLEVLGFLRELWGPGLSWRLDANCQPPEARYLKLDCNKAKTTLGWEPKWNLKEGLEATVRWYKYHQSGQDVRALALQQIRSYQNTWSLPEITRT
jgi:CDP-glucose 4,6-dehydratase